MKTVVISYLKKVKLSNHCSTKYCNQLTSYPKKQINA